MNLTIAANWKMYKTTQETQDFMEEFKLLQEEFASSQVVICPPFTSLSAAGELLSGTQYSLGAQNMLWESEGAFTGEISPLMLKDQGVNYIILGHSERRWIMGETNEQINKKLKAAFQNNLVPIFCVGETEENRKAGETDSVILEQLREGLKGINPADINDLVIAYEPVWAIGTGLAATKEDAVKVIEGCILKEMKDFMGDSDTRVRVLYGGSVKEDNIGDFVSAPGIDGALVGGASLKTDSFAGLIRAAQNALRAQEG